MRKLTIKLFCKTTTGRLDELAETLGYRTDRKERVVFIHYSQAEEHHWVIDQLKKMNWIVQYVQNFD